MELQMESLLKEHEGAGGLAEKHSPVKNLDRFFTSMYLYHVNKGLPAIILNQLSTILVLGFTIAFSVFLIAFLDWSALLECRDESTCLDLEQYILSNPLSSNSSSSFLFKFFLVFYALLFTAYWIWRCFSAVFVITSAIQMETFYREKLGLVLSDLPVLRWHEVVQRLVRLHEHGIHRVAVKERLTEHDVVLRIMRKDNYMIGLINKQLLDLKVPWWMTPFMSNRLFLTKSLEWSLSFCILEYVFNDNFNISSLFLKDKAALQRRFVVVGLIHMLLSPFILLFMVIHFFLQNAQQFHSNKAYLGPRQWSPLALWTFREFNELPHVFEDRINQSYAPTNEYLALFHNPYIAIVARCIAYISGSFVAVLLLISFLGESVLLYVHFGDHNLLWHVGIFSAVFAACRSMVPDETKARSAPHEECVTRIAAHTHYYPAYWVDRGHTTFVKDELAELFPYKINLFCMEVMSVLLTPLVLVFSLPNSASAILDFIRDHSKYVDGIGAVCDYSLFDLDRYGNMAYGAAESGREDDKQKPANGKMEQSFVSFKGAHPNWSGDERSQAMLGRLAAYKATKVAERDAALTGVLQQSMFLQGGQTQSVTSAFQQDDAFPIDNVDAPAQQQPQSKRHPCADDTNLQGVKSGAALLGMKQGVWGHHGYVTTDPPQADQVQMQARQAALSTSAVNSSSIFPVHRSALMGQSSIANALNRSDGGVVNLPSILRSILKQENIDYENDFYWMARFQQERQNDPANLEKSLHQSMSLFGLHEAVTLRGHNFN